MGYKHGHLAYTGPTIGGGADYPDVFTGGKYQPDTRDELLTSLSYAGSGDRIWIPEGVKVRIDGLDNLVVPSGVTLCSRRDRNNPGQIQQLSKGVPQSGENWPETFILKAGARVSGLVVEGPHKDVTKVSYQWSGLFAKGDNIEIDNNEIWGWPHAAVLASGSSKAGRLRYHHNNVHHNQQDGLGYGIYQGIGWSEILANLYDYSRHAIAGGWGNCNYEAAYNLLGPHCTNTVIDMHGGVDANARGQGTCYEWAGGEVWVHHNTCQHPSQPTVGVRGVPGVECLCEWNWTYYAGSESNPYSAFRQVFVMDGVPCFGGGTSATWKKYKGWPEESTPRMFARDNHYGSSTPPWYDEGIVMSNLTINPGQVPAGGVAQLRVRATNNDTAPASTRVSPVITRV